ncbi:hypothetical protein GC173_02565 [bacterium]|nr:hypothetical protein [bacterium]
MLSTCRCSSQAEASLRTLMGLPEATRIAGVELEFKELPYFIVSRAKVRWDPAMGDINVIQIDRINDQGLVVDTRVLADDETDGEPGQLTFIPWPNVVSLSITRAPEGGKGSEQA